MSKVKQNAGVHTYAVGMTLTAAQYHAIKNRLGHLLRKSTGDSWSKAEHYMVDSFREKGIMKNPCIHLAEDYHFMDWNEQLVAEKGEDAHEIHGGRT